MPRVPASEPLTRVNTVANFCPHSPRRRAIIDTATPKNCDLIVIASHGRSGVSAVILGSQTKVLRHSKIPVLVYR
jgi:nucleotide-binding universal stress UspA family protein